MATFSLEDELLLKLLCTNEVMGFVCVFLVFSPFLSKMSSHRLIVTTSWELSTGQFLRNDKIIQTN